MFGVLETKTPESPLLTADRQPQGGSRHGCPHRLLSDLKQHRHPVELEKGRQGQFEVIVNGRSVVSRKGGLLAKLLRRPWPTDDDVLTAVQESAATG